LGRVPREKHMRKKGKVANYKTGTMKKAGVGQNVKKQEYRRHKKKTKGSMARKR